MNSHWLLVVLSLTSISGCGNSNPTGPIITDSSKIVVEPGRGVPKICEVGMSFADVKKATGDASLHGLYDREPFWQPKRFTQEKFVLIPSLGVIGVPEKKDGLPLLTFYVQPYDGTITVRGLAVTNPFRGSILNRLSFSNHIVGRKEVESAFGVITQAVTNASLTFDHLDKTQPFVFIHPNFQTLYYHRLGLSFELKTNVVESFSVSKPAPYK